MIDETILETGVADLHIHTTASDGTIGVGRRVELAAERDLDAIAITDHDVIADALTERTERRDGVELIAGVEIRADLFDTKIEILGHFVDPTHEGLLETLKHAREFRRQRNADLVANLAEATGLDFSYEDLAASVDGNLGRPHLADVLIEAGVVDSVGEAFGEYLAEEGEAFVPMERLPVAEVVETIHAAGGTASLAHPGRIRASADAVAEMLDELTNLGLDGLEVQYPYGAETSDDYADVDVATAADLTERFDLIPTGGSDCHGPDSGKFRQGEVRVERDVLDRLRSAAGA